MNNSFKHFITINNKKSYYTVRLETDETCFVECVDANISQEFLNEDLPALLSDLPSLIIAEKKYKKQESEVIRFRVSSDDKKNIERNAVKNGYSSVSEYLRDLSLSNASFVREEKNIY